MDILVYIVYVYRNNGIYNIYGYNDIQYIDINVYNMDMDI